MHLVKFGNTHKRERERENSCPKLGGQIHFSLSQQIKQGPVLVWQWVSRSPFAKRKWTQNYRKLAADFGPGLGHLRGEQPPQRQRISSEKVWT